MEGMMNNSTFAVFTVALLAVTVSLGIAAVPQLISLQGKLTDVSGTPVPDGTYQVTFTIYDSEIGGDSKWSEINPAVVAVDGAFDVLLGSINPIHNSVFSDEGRWLGITLAGDDEMTPRWRIGSAPFAQRVSTIDGSAGGTISGAVTLNGRVDVGLDSVGVSIDLHNGSGLPTVTIFNAEQNGGGIYLNDENGVSQILMYPDPDGSGARMYIDGGMIITGTAVTGILEITGGSDLAEPFAISDSVSLPVGALVVIDDKNPGELKMSAVPYDRRVAGVVSGAGGINPGLTLKQGNVPGNGRNIALTGWVYALATASNGGIIPGDLLTTSKLPGYAMKATDKGRRDGAVVGKAMTALEKGEGLILVLVNLQ